MVEFRDMFNKLKQAGDLAKLAKQARDLQNALDKEDVVVEENDIKIVITATQKIKSFEVKGVSNDMVVQILNKAIKKSQEAAARKMQEMSGGLGGMMKGLMGNQ